MSIVKLIFLKCTLILYLQISLMSKAFICLSKHSCEWRISVQNFLICEIVKCLQKNYCIRIEKALANYEIKVNPQ